MGTSPLGAPACKTATLWAKKCNSIFLVYMLKIDKILLAKLQQGFPLAKRPYQYLGMEIGLTEQKTRERVILMRKNNLIRRIGPVFANKKAGRYTTLIAFKVPQDRIEAIAGIISRQDYVSHNYLRQGEYNLWFTITAQSRAQLNHFIRCSLRMTGIKEYLNLPATRVFKLRAEFKL